MREARNRLSLYGGSGGTIPSSLNGGMGGIAAGASTLVPLAGGALAAELSGPKAIDGRGGGAAQSSSRTSALIEGIVSVRGEAGGIDLFAQTQGLFVTGGGAGGSLLLEAPKLELGSNAKLLATGGDGAAGCSVATQQCGLGGLGAHAEMAATSGADASCLGIVSIRKSTGGGGGGLGRVRINTKDGTYVKTSSAVEDAVLTTGELSTR